MRARMIIALPPLPDLPLWLPRRPQPPPCEPGIGFTRLSTLAYRVRHMGTCGDIPATPSPRPVPTTPAQATATLRLGRSALESGSVFDRAGDDHGKLPPGAPSLLLIASRQPPRSCDYCRAS